jgi:glucosyl-3-phosphoglycerate synthase
VGTLKKGISEFKKDPVGIPMLSAWVRINAALPDFSQRIAGAVGLDNKPND